MRMRMFLLMVVAFVALTYPVSASTLSITNISASSGASVDIPIMVTDMPAIGSFDLVIAYDPSVLAITSVSDGDLITGMAVNTGVAGEIRLGYASIAGFSGTGSIAVLTFDVTGSTGDVSDISITSASATSPSLASISFIPVDGVFTVEDVVYTALLNISDATAYEGGVVNVPITITSTAVPSIGSFDLVLTYDSTILNATSVIDGGLTTGIVGGINIPGQVSINYASASGFSGDGTIATVRFDVIGSAGDLSSLTFTTAIATTADAPPSPVNLGVDSAVISVIAGVKGDLSGDAIITSVDALYILQMAAGNIGVNLAGDFNHDGLVNSVDALMILQHVAGNIDINDY